jgi:hypothetical protein
MKIGVSGPNVKWTVAAVAGHTADGHDVRWCYGNSMGKPGRRTEWRGGGERDREERKIEKKIKENKNVQFSSCNFTPFLLFNNCLKSPTKIA